MTSKYRPKNEEMGQLGARDLDVTTTNQKIPMCPFSASQKTGKGKWQIRICNCAGAVFFKAEKTETKLFKTSK